MKTRPANQRRVLVTMTNEPRQPTRLYYSVPDRVRVIRKLEKLQCMVESPSERCWQWLFHAEAAQLRFSGGGYEDVPEQKRPIVLGRIRFSTHDTMTFETNSIDRAIAGARFFAPRLGPDVVAIRRRRVDRFSLAAEGAPDPLMANLDQGVEVTDPRAAEAALKRTIAGTRSLQAVERKLAEDLEKRLQRQDDVPMVEDFPLAADEETPELGHLTCGLQLRVMRALEHWNGNTHLTLTASIVRAVEQRTQARGGHQAP